MTTSKPTRRSLLKGLLASWIGAKVPTAKPQPKPWVTTITMTQWKPAYTPFPAISIKDFVAVQSPEELEAFLKRDEP